MEHLVHIAHNITLQLDGLDLMEQSLAEAQQWLAQVAGALDQFADRSGGGDTTLHGACRRALAPPRLLTEPI